MLFIPKIKNDEPVNEKDYAIYHFISFYLICEIFIMNKPENQFYLKSIQFCVNYKDRRPHSSIYYELKSNSDLPIDMVYGEPKGKLKKIRHLSCCEPVFLQFFTNTNCPIEDLLSFTLRGRKGNVRIREIPLKLKKAENCTNTTFFKLCEENGTTNKDDKKTIYCFINSSNSQDADMGSYSGRFSYNDPVPQRCSSIDFFIFHLYQFNQFTSQFLKSEKQKNIRDLKDKIIFLLFHCVSKNNNDNYIFPYDFRLLNSENRAIFFGLSRSGLKTKQDDLFFNLPLCPTKQEELLYYKPSKIQIGQNIKLNIIHPFSEKYSPFSPFSPCPQYSLLNEYISFEVYIVDKESKPRIQKAIEHFFTKILCPKKCSINTFKEIDINSFREANNENPTESILDLNKLKKIISPSSIKAIDAFRERNVANSTISLKMLFLINQPEFKEIAQQIQENTSMIDESTNPFIPICIDRKDCSPFIHIKIENETLELSKLMIVRDYILSTISKIVFHCSFFAKNDEEISRFQIFRLNQLLIDEDSLHWNDFQQILALYNNPNEILNQIIKIDDANNQIIMKNKEKPNFNEILATILATVIASQNRYEELSNIGKNWLTNKLALSHTSLNDVIDNIKDASQIKKKKK